MKKTKSIAKKRKRKGEEKTYNRTYQERWEEVGIDYSEAQEWISAGFKSDDYYRVKQWKNHGFALWQTKEWLAIGFKPSDYDKFDKWKLQGFKHQQIREWIKAGLKPEDYEFATYLKWKRYDPNQTLNLEQLRKEFPVDQEYLDIIYPKKQRKEITKLNILSKSLRGILDLSDFVNLEKLDCSNNQLVALKLDKCLKLKELNCYSNKLTTLNLVNCSNLQEINCSNNFLTEIKLPTGVEKLETLNLENNKFTKLDIDNYKKIIKLNISNNNFSEQDLSFLNNLTDLKGLKLGNDDDEEKSDREIHNHFTGSLEPLRNAIKLESLSIFNTDIYGSLKSLRNMNRLNELNITDTDIDSGLEYLPDRITRFSCSVKKRNNSKCKVIEELLESTEKKYLSFPQKFQVYKQWIRLNFFEEEINQWINAGVKLDDYKFIAWLKTTKKETPEWITNYKEDYQILSERFKKYGLCPECKQPNTGDKWCQACNKSRLEKMAQTVSNNPKINEFIQKYQLEATEADKFLEWIPYEQFIDVEYLAEGGFGKVYKAKWSEGDISHWDMEKKQWKRKKDHYWEEEDKNKYGFEWNKDQYKKTKNHREVVLKSLNNSSTNTDFLEETEKHKIIDDWFNNIVPCYGLSQDPNTGNYVMVMKYIEGGDLRKYLKNSKNLTFQDKLRRLVNIAQGLKDIHSKNLVHRDFHSGNILSEINKCYITDLGLCQPTDTEDKGEVYGVLPYVAPEVLNGISNEHYTPKADIYSFGVVAYELFANASPYLDREYDRSLALDIVCDKLRPNLEDIKVPLMMKNLIERCWDADSKNRPTTNQLVETLRNWQNEISSSYQIYDYSQSYHSTRNNSEFYQQYKAVEKEYNQMSQSIGYKHHPTEKLTSRKLDFKNLSKTQNLKATSSYNLCVPSNTSLSIISESTDEYYSRELGFDIEDEENSSSGIDQTLTNKTKRQLSLESQTKTNQGETKSIKIGESQSYQSEPMQIDCNWQNIHSNFTEELIQNWQKNFTYTQTKDWINIGLKPTDYNLANYLKNKKNLTPEETLNNHNLNSLKLEFQEFNQFQQNQQNSEQTQTVQQTTTNWPNN